VKRKAKQSGSGGRLRWGLLMATVAAFLLVPVGQAFAGVPLKVTGAGEGSGWVKGVGTPEERGNPEVKCHWNGELQEFDEVWNGTEFTAGVPTPGKCEGEAINVGIGEGAVALEGEHDPGSLLYGWHVEEGLFLSGCEEPVTAQTETCAPLQFSPAPAGIKVKATFNLKSEPLTLTASGAAGGEFECEINNSGTPGSCPTEAPVLKTVKVYPTGTGVELNEWTSGPCASTADNPCSFTMPEAPVSANAEFAVASETYAVTAAGGGTGTLVCEVEGSPASCSGSALYGETIHVTATPDAENIVEKIDTTGSAACSVASEGVSGECTFVIHANSTATVYFESAGTKSEADVNTVNGEVPIKTALESSCPSVYLGEFEAGVTHNYHNTCTVKLTSTGVETELTAADETGEAPTGHLVQDYVDKNSVAHHYSLPSALEAAAIDSEGKATGGVGSSLTGLETPVTLLAFEEPIAKDLTTLEFNQPISNHDGLHTGPYSKTITLTLEQTTP
jgi:hypothetical protein